ncbi:MAG: tRNA (adenosine(37)-N6)-dimethylallyltransferase MiaA [Acutalibacteraceae bacterium]|nr:tRNA (adenosine(37)-N6)-dimethylallyltransferase MiaA [Acutalibacteraceae bacterium]
MNTENKIPLIVVCGPTASGKTGLGIRLAQIFNGEIVSADSMQIYKGMDIATAKPTTEEMQGIVHHLMGFVEPTESYSVAEYVDVAHNVIKNIYNRGKIPILVGGTGLYINSLVNNIEFGKENSDDNIRKELNQRLIDEGADSLLKELESFDPNSAKRLGTSNHRRLIRAIEIYKTTGKTMTQFIEESKLVPTPYKDVRIGLSCENRQNLYDKINKRVDIMVESGLLAEAEQFRKNNYSTTAVKAIGYKELEPYFTGNSTLETALESLKRETRRYAKRQLTWFRRDEKINWIYTDTISDDEIINQAVEIVNKSEILLKSICK